MKKGCVSQVLGLVVDVCFEDGYLFEIYNVIKILQLVVSENEVGIDLMFEVVFYLGDDIVCIIVMVFMDGVQCGMEVVDIGVLILVLVGDVIFGCVFNVFGENIDLNELVFVDVKKDLIYRQVFLFDQLLIEVEIFEIGIKVVDLFVLYIKGGKIGLFGGVGVGKIVLIQELINNIV